MSMSRTSEQRWNRLQLEYRRAVSAEYPNLGREGCPGPEALRDLAERMVLREDLQQDLRWKHAIQCGPCFQEYITLRGIDVVKESGARRTSPSPIRIKKSA
jgi:hypothetical protein